MSDRPLGSAVDRALDHQRRGRVGASEGERAAEVDVSEVGPIGVRVKRVAVRAPRAGVAEVAEALPERLRSLGERVAPVEVDPRLGGATLRSRPEEMREREFFEVEVRGDEVSVERYRVGEDGRAPVEFDLTRRQLRALVDELG
jgi:hypothetical protein